MRILTIKELSGKFLITDATTNKHINFFKIPKDIKKINGYYNSVKYYIDPLEITEECFNALNSKKVFSSYKEFKKYSTNAHKEYKKNVILKEKEKIKQKKIRDKEKIRQNKIRERERKKIEREQNLISKSYKNNLNNIWFKNKDTKYIIHFGPTNSGKTHNAIKSLLESNSGVYLSPLRLLSYEIYDKINSEGHSCDLITGEEYIIGDNSKFSSRTVEMMDYDKSYDVVVIDECFMLGDKDRGKSWLKALLETNAKEIHLITSLEATTIIENILTKTNKKFEKIRYKRLVPLVTSENNYPLQNPLDKSIFITFSRIDCLIQKSIFEKKGLNVSVLYGNLPPEIKKEQMRKFADGETSVCISTDVIGMGLNLPCDHICFLKTTKYDGHRNRDLTPTELKQIAGRAGRYNLSNKGTVWGTNKGTNKFINSYINSPPNQISKTYSAIDVKTLSEIPRDTIEDKLLFYKDLKYIPDTLSDIITLEPIDKYLKLLYINKYINKLDINIAWKLLCLPVKQNTGTWNYLVKRVISDEIVHTNFSDPKTPIRDVNDLKLIEDEVNDIDLYIYFSNIKEFKHLITDTFLEELKKYKIIFVNNITKFLLDKKLSKKKYCVTCGTNVGILWQHKECDTCHSKKRRYYYDDDYYY